MKILSIILLIVSALAAGIIAWFAYFPESLSQCPPYSLIKCVKVVLPNRLMPLWWPPIAILAWIFSLFRCLKGRFGQSILLSAAIIVSMFVFGWLGAQGFLGTY